MYNTFDTTFALSSFILWLLFGYLSGLMSCDIQRFMNNHDGFKHLIAILAFFLLFTIMDSKNNAPVYIIWFKTIYVYVLFLMIIKSKWYFVISVLLILIIDQTIKAHLNYLEKNGGNVKAIAVYNNIRKVLNIGIIVIIIIGFMHYSWRQYIDFGSDFSPNKLIFGIHCKK